MNRTTGQKGILSKEKFHTDIRKYFFKLRFINVWNILPGHVVEAKTLKCGRRVSCDYYILPIRRKKIQREKENKEKSTSCF